MLEASGVQISYGRNIILKDVAFTAPEASGTALLGKNGSGKSTFLKALSGVRKPDKGEILLDGVSVFEKCSRQRIGFVPQNDIVFDELTVFDNLAFWGAAYGVKKSNIINSSVIKLLGLEGTLRKKAGTLSGGTKKRCNIAASVLHEPDVLILDEPFSEVDLIAKCELIEYLAEIKNGGKTLVITSHNASELAVLCEHFCFISAEKIEKANGIDKNNAEESIINIIRRGF